MSAYVTGHCAAGRHVNLDAPLDGRYCRRVYGTTTRPCACGCACHPENPNYGGLWPELTPTPKPRKTKARR